MKTDFELRKMQGTPGTAEEILASEEEVFSMD
jgi:hypothetical protein